MCAVMKSAQVRQGGTVDGGEGLTCRHFSKHCGQVECFPTYWRTVRLIITRFSMSVRPSCPVHYCRRRGGLIAIHTQFIGRCGGRQTSLVVYLCSQVCFDATCIENVYRKHAKFLYKTQNVLASIEKNKT